MRQQMERTPDRTIHGLDLCGSLRGLDPAEWPCLPLLVVARCRQYLVDTGVEGAEGAEGSEVSVHEVENGHVHTVDMTVGDGSFRVLVEVDEYDLLAWFALYEQIEASMGAVALTTIARPGESVRVCLEEARPLASIILQNDAGETTWTLEGVRATIPDLMRAIASSPRRNS